MAEPTTEPATLNPLRDRLAKVLARKQWDTKLRSADVTLECWTTRAGSMYVVQVWPNGAWTVFGVVGHDDDPAALEKLV